jgi:TonB family protein
VRTAILITSAVLLGAASLPPATTTSAQTVDPWSAAPCPIGVNATRIAGTPDAVIVRLRSVPAPGATITAYGTATAWSGTIDRYATAALGNDRNEYSFVARAGGPIEAILYQPPDATCIGRAVVRGRDYFDGADVERPTLVLGDAQPLAPINCAHRYAPPSTVVAFQPVTPQAAQAARITGTVMVLVTIDEFGKPTHARIQSSPSAVLNQPSIDAALRSVFSPEIFRCRSVPGSYIFGVSYTAR